MFCIRAISNYVSIVEAEVMPQVLHLLYLYIGTRYLLLPMCVAYPGAEILAPFGLDVQY